MQASPDALDSFSQAAIAANLQFRELVPLTCAQYFEPLAVKLFELPDGVICALAIDRPAAIAAATVKAMSVFINTSWAERCLAASPN